MIGCSVSLVQYSDSIPSNSFIVRAPNFFLLLFCSIDRSEKAKENIYGKTYKKRLERKIVPNASSRSVSRNDPNSVAVSNNVQPQSRFSIMNLDSGTKYELRVTAYNNAGSTQAEYLFTTLSPTGSNRIHDEHPPETEETSLLFDAHVLAPSVISLLAVFLTVAGVCFCLKTRKSSTLLFALRY